MSWTWLVTGLLVDGGGAVGRLLRIGRKKMFSRVSISTRASLDLYRGVIRLTTANAIAAASRGQRGDQHFLRQSARPSPQDRYHQPGAPPAPDTRAGYPLQRPLAHDLISHLRAPRATP